MTKHGCLIFYTICTIIAYSMICLPQAGAVAEEFPGSTVLVLCYHSIQPQVKPGKKHSDTLSQKRFVEQIEYLRTHGYHPISFQDLAKASQGVKELPSKPVLLSFDDGYLSYYDFVVPILKQYGYPSMVAIVGAWVEKKPPEDVPEKLMTWRQIRQLANNPLVTVVSHSYDLHKTRQYTPQGNVAPVVAVRGYLANQKRYETEKEYRRKLELDFQRQEKLFVRHIGKAPEAIVWPYGYYTKISMQVARNRGVNYQFSLDENDFGPARLKEGAKINRLLISNYPITSFIRNIKKLKVLRAPIRAMQVDLDLVFNPDSEKKTDENLGKLIDRMVQIGVNTVFLQAFSDAEDTGDIQYVYFQNRVMPVRADILGHVVNQISIRQINVFACMPAPGIVFQYQDFNNRLRVMKSEGGKVQQNSSRCKAPAPLSEKATGRVAMLYEDLAARTKISGILFQDNVYLTKWEDHQRLGFKALKKQTGKEFVFSSDPVFNEQWAKFKTPELFSFTEKMADSVRKYRPDALFARNLYPALPGSDNTQVRFSQDYDQFLKNYDYVVIMAYPGMEQVAKPERWLKNLSSKTLENPLAKQKTVFKLQAYNPRRKQWIDDRLLVQQIRSVLGSGIMHLAYYPDNFWEQKPAADIIRMEMSAN
ncbi:MAG: poly-beta-1,6-N-acetyl-D-glucosamine N-deacetylase PgaB [Desulfobacteraceae bacterium]|nr:poly-beta-1,6-N-acetyl-D-glucosamine N-deacetylase PgaB [Desulfobacteraceae bacterium]